MLSENKIALGFEYLPRRVATFALTDTQRKKIPEHFSNIQTPWDIARLTPSLLHKQIIFKKEQNNVGKRAK